MPRTRSGGGGSILRGEGGRETPPRGSLSRTGSPLGRIISPHDIEDISAATQGVADLSVRIQQLERNASPTMQSAIGGDEGRHEDETFEEAGSESDMPSQEVFNAKNLIQSQLRSSLRKSRESYDARHALSPSASYVSQASPPIPNVGLGGMELGLGNSGLQDSSNRTIARTIRKVLSGASLETGSPPFDTLARDALSRGTKNDGRTSHDDMDLSVHGALSEHRARGGRNSSVQTEHKTSMESGERSSSAMVSGHNQPDRTGPRNLGIERSYFAAEPESQYRRGRLGAHVGPRINAQGVLRGLKRTHAHEYQQAPLEGLSHGGHNGGQDEGQNRFNDQSYQRAISRHAFEDKPDWQHNHSHNLEMSILGDQSHGDNGLGGGEARSFVTRHGNNRQSLHTSIRNDGSLGFRPDRYPPGLTKQSVGIVGPHACGPMGGGGSGSHPNQPTGGGDGRVPRHPTSGGGGSPGDGTSLYATEHSARMLHVWVLEHRNKDADRGGVPSTQS